MERASERASTRAPAQPTYVFRGHTSQIHSAELVRRNTCLVTGDADGWVVCWKLESKRPVAVWKAHDGAILGAAEWGSEKLITHGRDHTLRIWQLSATGLSTLSTVLPADGATTHRPKPWLLHSLPVNTLNFCAFSMCYEKRALDVQQHDTTSDAVNLPSTRLGEHILVAVPARDDKKIEVYTFPDERLVAVVPRVELLDTGMVMAVKLVHHRPSNNTLVVAGYEGGVTAVHLVPRNPAIDQTTRNETLKITQTIYLSQPHTQPVLSLDASPDGTIYFTSSADAVIAAHRVPDLPLDEDSPIATPEDVIFEALENPPNVSLAPHSPHEVVDSLPLSSSTNDNHQPLKPITKTTSAPASDESTVEPIDFSKKPPSTSATTSTLSFSKQPVPSPFTSPTSAAKPAGLASLISAAPPQPKFKPPPPTIPTTVTIQPPYKTLKTKHAGQQSLNVRSDGRLLLTGGWDSRIRLYSTKTLKEMAVLKWHKEGVYAAAFGKILLDAENIIERAGERKGIGADEGAEVIRRETGLGKLQQQREEQMQLKHWVVAGAKDGKVSLWEVF